MQRQSIRLPINLMYVACDESQRHFMNSSFYSALSDSDSIRNEWLTVWLCVYLHRIEINENWIVDGGLLITEMWIRWRWQCLPKANARKKSKQFPGHRLSAIAIRRCSLVNTESISLLIFILCMYLHDTLYMREKCWTKHTALPQYANRNLWIAQSKSLRFVFCEHATVAIYTQTLVQIFFIFCDSFFVFLLILLNTTGSKHVEFAIMKWWLGGLGLQKLFAYMCTNFRKYECPTPIVVRGQWTVGVCKIANGIGVLSPWIADSNQRHQQ